MKYNLLKRQLKAEILARKKKALELYKSGVPKCLIAKELGVTRQCISHYIYSISPEYKQKMEDNKIVREITKFKSQEESDELAHKIIDEVLSNYNITLEVLNKPDRHRELFQIRKEVAKELSKHGFSSVEIGKYLRKDHSTALYYLR